MRPGTVHWGIPGMESPAPSLWGRSVTIKQQHAARELSVNAQLVSSMKLNPQTVCQLTFLSLCCVLITVRESDSVFVPGRCPCLTTQRGVRGQMKGLTVFPKSPTCNNVTVIVTLKKNNAQVCLDPEGPMGKQLIRCFNRTQKLGRDVKLCLRRRKGRRGNGQRQQPRNRRRGHNRRASSSNSQ
ncbi:C-X-C motif chemokine 5-like [Amphiprion ocellaris]|uniref:Chemokine interleukin-8-like domain-containing protein n=1 Tax=Amphiprion ocellaris TaxID=80972 RepID=A0A3Q1CL14_AMPOC|nr:C-X-C motif chemokine 5-like [Amphiprion ocellaris]